MKHSSEVSVAFRRNMHESLQKALSRLHSSLNIDTTVDKIVIKPSIYDPELPGNTSPDIIRSVVRIFENVSDIIIVESDTRTRSANDAFKALRLDQLVGDNVSLVNLSKSHCSNYRMSGHYLKEAVLSDSISRNSFLINLATLKINPQDMTYSGAIKNLFGLLPQVNKEPLHPFLDDVLLDLLEYYRPTLTILELGDVVIGNREDGLIRHIGGVVVGTDAIAVDSYCVSLFRLEPPQIPVLKRAYELGLGEVLPERIKELGTDYQIDKLKESCSSAIRDWSN